MNKFRTAAMLAALMITAPAMAEECNRDAAQWLSRTEVLVYIPGDGLRPTMTMLKGRTLFLFPTNGVSKETACEVTGAKPSCLD
jgi:hypothetical protein